MGEGKDVGVVRPDHAGEGAQHRGQADGHHDQREGGFVHQRMQHKAFDQRPKQPGQHQGGGEGRQR